MNVLIVYDSYFGNTEQVAKAIGSALAAQDQVQTVKVSEAKVEQLQGVELLIAGAPTRGFRPSEGMQAFLKAIPAGGLRGIQVAAFDTRLALEDIPQKFVRFLVRTFGYAAKPIADSLKAKGGSLVTAPEGFHVKDTEGPLKEGELERAAAWAVQARG